MKRKPKDKPSAGPPAPAVVKPLTPATVAMLASLLRDARAGRQPEVDKVVIEAGYALPLAPVSADALPRLSEEAQAAVGTLRNLLTRAEESGDDKTALLARKELNKLLGLYSTAPNLMADDDPDKKKARFTVKNYRQVVEFFGCANKVVIGCMQAGMPYAKSRYDLQEICRWVWKRMSGRLGQDDKSREERMQATREMRLLRKIQREKEEGLLISKEDHEQVILELVRLIRSTLDRMPGELAGRLAGLPKDRVATELAAYAGSAKSDLISQLGVKA